MKKCIFFVLSFFLSSYSVFARGRQELVPASSWIYDAMAAIAMEEGRLDLSDQAPISIAEISLYLSECDYDSLSAAGKAQYDRIMDYIGYEPLSFRAGIFSLGAEPEINLEGQYKTNDDIDWVYDRYQRQALIDCPVYINGGDYFTLSTDMCLKQNKGQMSHDDNYTNIPLAANQVDINFPDTGYGSFGCMLTKDSGVNFQLGMGNQSVGRSLSGSVIMSEYFTNASYANLEFFHNNFRYNMNITQFNVDKYMYTHRLEVRLFKKFQFAAMESILVNHSMELRFLNPLTIFHGMSPWRDYGDETGNLDKDDPESHTCAYMCFKIAYVPIKSLRIYLLFAQDQFQTPYETSHWPDNTTPRGISGQLGLESYIPYKAGYFHFWLEGTYTDPFMYIKEDPNWSLVRTYSENIGDMAIFYEWVGSPFGPDTLAGELNAGYEVPGKWAVTASYLLKGCGEYSGTKIFTDALDWGGQDKVADINEWVYPESNPAETKEEGKEKQSWWAPHGTVELVNRAAVRASFSPNKYLTITAQPAFVFIFNSGNVKDEFISGGEFALSTKINLSRIF